MRILVVDDDPSCRFLLTSFLSDEGHELLEAECGNKALEIVDTCSVNVAFIDYGLPDCSGIDLAGDIKSKAPSCKIVMLTGHRQEEIKESLEAIDSFLTKPFSLVNVAAVIAKLE